MPTWPSRWTPMSWGRRWRGWPREVAYNTQSVRPLMIEVQNLTKHYGSLTAIRDVSFSVAPGDIVGFLGPNGAGKSTTMRILSCFLPASSGTAKVAGYDVFRESMEVRKRIGYLPENVPLYGDMRVAPYLDFVAEVKGVGRSARRSRVAEVMERTLITDMQDR